MPSLVVEVLKKEGDRVEAGEVIVIFEAMKMESELRTNKSGMIAVLEKAAR